MLLYVMRHGDAVQFARTDAERPLSDWGREQASKMVPHLTQCLPTRIIASPYLRAQQTARIVCDGLKVESFETVTGITPESDPFLALRQLQAFENEVLLMVSHQPLVSSLIGLLVDGHLAGGYMMGTASIAHLSLDMVGPGHARLEWLRHAS